MVSRCFSFFEMKHVGELKGVFQAPTLTCGKLCICKTVRPLCSHCVWVQFAIKRTPCTGWKTVIIHETTYAFYDGPSVGDRIFHGVWQWRVGRQAVNNKAQHASKPPWENKKPTEGKRQRNRPSASRVGTLLRMRAILYLVRRCS